DEAGIVLDAVEGKRGVLVRSVEFRPDRKRRVGWVLGLIARVVAGQSQAEPVGRLKREAATDRLHVLTAQAANDAAVGREARVALRGEIEMWDFASELWCAATVHVAGEIEHTLISAPLLEGTRNHQRQVVGERHVEPRASVGAIVTTYRDLHVRGRVEEIGLTRHDIDRARQRVSSE